MDLFSADLESMLLTKRAYGVFSDVQLTSGQEPESVIALVSLGVPWPVHACRIQVAVVEAVISENARPNSNSGSFWIPVKMRE